MRMNATGHFELKSYLTFGQRSRNRPFFKYIDICCNGMIVFVLWKCSIVSKAVISPSLKLPAKICCLAVRRLGKQFSIASCQPTTLLALWNSPRHISDSAALYPSCRYSCRIEHYYTHACMMLLIAGIAPNMKWAIESSPWGQLSIAHFTLGAMPTIGSIMCACV